MTTGRATLIYNPLAGTLNIDRLAQVVAQFWRDRGWDVVVRATQSAGHGRLLAREAAEAGHDLVLASGGDGTLGEIAGGLAGSQTVMAPVPSGTGNSFAKELLLSNRGGLLRGRTLINACKKLAEGRIQEVDLGCCNNEEYWLLWASVGADSFAVSKIEPRSRFARKFGSVGYMALATPHLPKFPGMNAKVTIDGKSFSGEYLMVIVSNCRRYAGGSFLLSPQASYDDGSFEVWFFKGRSGWGLYRYLVILSMGRHLNHEDVTMVSGRDILIETDSPLPYHRDGDPAGKTPLHCWIKPASLRLLVPETVSASVFVGQGVAFDG